MLDDIFGASTVGYVCQTFSQKWCALFPSMVAKCKHNTLNMGSRQALILAAGLSIHASGLNRIEAGIRLVNETDIVTRRNFL